MRRSSSSVPSSLSGIGARKPRAGRRRSVSSDSPGQRSSAHREVFRTLAARANKLLSVSGKVSLDLPRPRMGRRGLTVHREALARGGRLDDVGSVQGNRSGALRAEPGHQNLSVTAGPSRKPRTRSPARPPLREPAGHALPRLPGNRLLELHEERPAQRRSLPTSTANTARCNAGVVECPLRPPPDVSRYPTPSCDSTSARRGRPFTGQRPYARRAEEVLYILAGEAEAEVGDERGRHGRPRRHPRHGPARSRQGRRRDRGPGSDLHAAGARARHEVGSPAMAELHECQPAELAWAVVPHGFHHPHPLRRGEARGGLRA